MRVNVLTPVGVLGREQQLGVVKDMTDIVARAAGDPTLVERTWVIITESPDGGWGIDGHAYTRAEIGEAAKRALSRRLARPPKRDAGPRWVREGHAITCNVGSGFAGRKRSGSALVGPALARHPSDCARRAALGEAHHGRCGLRDRVRRLRLRQRHPHDLSALRYSHPDRGRWWWLLASGLAGIAIGAITFFSPGITAYVLGIFIGAWAIVTGIFEIVAGVQMRRNVAGEIFMILAGVLSVVLGASIFIFPAAGLLAVVWSWPSTRWWRASCSCCSPSACAGCAPNARGAQRPGR